MPETSPNAGLPIAVDATGPFEVRFWRPGWPKWQPAPVRPVLMPAHYRGKRKRKAGRRQQGGGRG
jgi:hypothetical protein